VDPQGPQCIFSPICVHFRVKLKIEFLKKPIDILLRIVIISIIMLIGPKKKIILKIILLPKLRANFRVL
jgi:hypothetical protein